jgi:hypothetical protein
MNDQAKTNTELIEEISCYLGEGEKGIFRFEDWRVKAIDKTDIFLHAGARRDYLRIYDEQTGNPPKVREAIPMIFANPFPMPGWRAAPRHLERFLLKN